MSERDLFYKICPNTTFTCKDGDLKINKIMLSDRTSKFDKLLEEPTVNASDFEISTLTTFFDLLLGFEEITTDNALKIFAVAHKYDVQDLVEKCIVQLKPKEMNENVIHSLNLAINTDVEKLIDTVIDFLLMYGINRLFLYEPYYFLLEPKSVAALLRYSYRNPLILKSVIQWGKNYIEKNQINSDARTFFQKIGILNKLSLGCLESIDSVLDLYDLDPKKNVFTETEILNYLKIELKPQEPRYEWVDIIKGQEMKEVFNFKHALGVCAGTKVYISFNSTQCDILPLKEKVNDNFFEVYIEITLQHSQYYSNKYSMNNICEKTQYNILPVENIGSVKSQICSIVQAAGPNDYYNRSYSLKSISVSYQFRRDCKVLKTIANMPKLENAADNEKLYFSCDIEVE